MSFASTYIVYTMLEFCKEKISVFCEEIEQATNQVACTIGAKGFETAFLPCVPMHSHKKSTRFLQSENYLHIFRFHPCVSLLETPALYGHYGCLQSMMASTNTLFSKTEKTALYLLAKTTRLYFPPGNPRSSSSWNWKGFSFNLTRTE